VSNNDYETSFMLIQRAKQPRIDVDHEVNVLFDPEGRKLILETLAHDFDLRYVGAIPESPPPP
jgi:hypothetical protein